MTKGYWANAMQIKICVWRTIRILDLFLYHILRPQTVEMPA